MRRGGELASRHGRLLLRGHRLVRRLLQPPPELRGVLGGARRRLRLLGGGALRLEHARAQRLGLLLGARRRHLRERRAAVLLLDGDAQTRGLALRRLALRLKRRDLLLQAVVLLLEDARALEHVGQTRVGIRRAHLNLVLARAHRREQALQLAHAVGLQPQAVARGLSLALRVRQARARHVQARLGGGDVALRLLARALEFGGDGLRRRKLIAQRLRLLVGAVARAFRLRERARQTVRLPLERLKVHHVLLVLALHRSYARVRLRQSRLARVERQPRALAVALERRRGGGDAPVLRAQLLVRAHHVVRLLARRARRRVRDARRLTRFLHRGEQLVALGGQTQELGVDNLLLASHRRQVLGGGAQLFAPRRSLRAVLLVRALRALEALLRDVQAALGRGARVRVGDGARLGGGGGAPRLLRRLRLVGGAALGDGQSLGARVELILQAVLVRVQRRNDRARARRLRGSLLRAPASRKRVVLGVHELRLGVARAFVGGAQRRHQVGARRV